MKNYKLLALIVTVVATSIAVIITSILTKQALVVCAVVATLTLLAGGVAIYIVMKKDKEIDQATFILDLYRSFNERPELLKLLGVIDEKIDGKVKKPFSDGKYYHEILEYLVWLRMLCSLIDRDIISIESVDETFSYKFFAFVNDDEIQKLEIVPNRTFYSLIYRVHARWTEYCRKIGKNIVNESHSLSKTILYSTLSK